MCNAHYRRVTSVGDLDAVIEADFPQMHGQGRVLHIVNVGPGLIDCEARLPKPGKRLAVVDAAIAGTDGTSIVHARATQSIRWDIHIR